MITPSNFLQVLLSIGFEKKSKTKFYKKDYGDCFMAVDFDNKELLYPESKGLIVNDKTTSNFDHQENFVVFECVCRLLNKGYRPEHIELERRWQLGREGKSGKADILVKDQNSLPLIIIECKTAGKEFNKEVKNTEEYGGQIFSYWQQEPATKWLALYASDYKNDKLSYSSPVINCTDDANIVSMAKNDNDVKLYTDAKNEKDKHETWVETYNRQWLHDLIFEDESQAYKIGISPLRKNKLKDFSPNDKIVNKFEEILRHNNVSDKENAFNRLIALFICKLVDEIQKQDFDEVEFQYKQGIDTYESLQDRLQRLHKQGMDDFMKEKIFYVEADYAERLFMQYTGQKRKAAIEDLKRTIRILKFYSNNDFAFKDVHNEELFYQNGKILVEVVQLFQPYRIVYPSKHQFLGDLFEQLLNKGFKQNEGQFFTPTPITRFIWDSLPISDYIYNNGLPRVIDYACGAGHFLTEAVEAINGVRKDGDNSWVEKHIYGVEKDYRLARVSKISMFMNGAGGTNIIFGDGLENYPEKEIENSSFDVLVANPPYSVSGFKQHLKLKNNTFELLNHISSDSSDIETLFVERSAQILKPRGIAAVVLPSSILSNNSSSYIGAREQLLKNFMIHAIVSFGSKTFGATGTNTIVLFMEKNNEPPKISELAKDSVNAIVQGLDDTNWEDKALLKEYCNHQHVDIENYKKFMMRQLSWNDLTADEYFNIYTDAFDVTLGIKYPKSYSKQQCETARMEHFYNYAINIEQEKLYYFSLTCKQLTSVIIAPSDIKEQKSFLGYDWSNRKGAEGIVINTPGGKLYDATDRFARGTLACAIRNSFLGATTSLSDDLAKYIKTYQLCNLIDFGRVEFDKIIKTNSIEEYYIESMWPNVSIGSVCKNVFAGGDKPKNISDIRTKENPYPVISNGIDNNGILGYVNEARVFENSVTVSARGTLGYPIVRNEPFLPIVRLIVAIPNEEKIINDYLKIAIELIHFENTGGVIPQLTVPNFNKEKIPQPPIDIQKKIVVEFKKVERIINNNKKQIDNIIYNIRHIISNIKGNKKIIGEICNLNEFTINPQKSPDKQYIYIDIDAVENGTGYIHKDKIIYGKDAPSRARRIAKSHSTLISTVRPNLRGFAYIDTEIEDAIFSTGFAIIRSKDESILLNHILYYSFMYGDDLMQQMIKAMPKGQYPSINSKNIQSLTFKVPSLKEQQHIVDEIAAFEEEIMRLEQEIADCPKKKQEILDKYLK